MSLFRMYDEMLENMVITTLDLIQAKREGQSVSAERVLKAILGKGRICPIPENEIDKRLSRLDDVQTYLGEAIIAIDDLKSQADENKTIQRQLMAELDVLRENQRQAKDEAESIKQSTKIEIDNFRKLAGIPTDSEMKRKKLTGFISGVFASLVAACILWGGESLVTSNFWETLFAAFKSPVN